MRVLFFAHCLKQPPNGYRPNKTLDPPQLSSDSWHLSMDALHIPLLHPTFAQMRPFVFSLDGILPTPRYADASRTVSTELLLSASGCASIRDVNAVYPVWVRVCMRTFNVNGRLGFGVPDHLALARASEDFPSRCNSGVEKMGSWFPGLVGTSATVVTWQPEHSIHPSPHPLPPTPSSRHLPVRLPIAEMRLTFFCTLVGFVATSTALSSGIEPAVELLPKLTPKNAKRGASVANSLQSREISGGFISVLPKDQSIPAEGASKRRRILTKDEVVVPESLREASSKRGLYCKNSGYGLCPNMEYCCPLGGLCCSNGGCCRKGQRCCKFDGCCPSSHNCVIVDGQEGCCPIGKVCTANGNGCASSGYVPCSNYNFCCRSGYTCYRDSAGNNLCRAPGSNSDDGDDDTTTRTTTTKITTTDEVFTQTTQTFEEDSTTTNIQTQQVTNPNTFGLPTVTPTFTLPAAANTTSSSSRTSSSSDIPLVASGATAIGVAHSVLISAVVFTLAQVFVA